MSSRLAPPDEREELALTIIGKCNHLRRADFIALADHLGIARTYSERKVAGLLALRETFTEMIAASRLSGSLRAALAEILSERLDRLR